MRCFFQLVIVTSDASCEICRCDGMALLSYMGAGILGAKFSQWSSFSASPTDVSKSPH